LATVERRRTGVREKRKAGVGRSAVREVAKRDPAGRRQAILDAALDLFARRGFQGTSVREIARGVGVNEATLYHYFASKADILDAIIDILLEERNDALAALEDPRVSLEQTLFHMTVRSLARLRAPREQKLVRLIMLEGPRMAVTGRYPFLRLMHDSQERIAAVFAKLVASGKMRPRNPYLTSMQFMAPIVIYGFHQHGLGGRRKEPIPETAFARAHAELFARGLAP
jgi:AcrR family transcriptional regulator